MAEIKYNEPDICPYCGAPTVSAGPLDATQLNKIYHQVRCIKCGAVITEVYLTTYIGFEDEDNNWHDVDEAEYG